MANLAQVSVLPGRGAGLLALILEMFPFLQYADFRLDTSSYNTFPDKGDFTGTSARAVNAAINRDTAAPTIGTGALAMYGRELSIDDVYRQDARVAGAPGGLALITQRRLNALAIQLAGEVVDDMFKGTGAANKMVGIAEFVKDAVAGGQTARLGLTAAELAAMNTNIDLQINTEIDQNTFVEELIKELANVPGANAIVTNTSLNARLSTIARRLGLAGESINSFGSQAKTFAGVPLVTVPDTAITQTESDGVNNDCTSLYIVRFGEDLALTFSTNSGFYFTDFDNLETKPEGMARLQFFLNLTVEKTNAMRRLSRIRL